jgi:hypothetical protein
MPSPSSRVEVMALASFCFFPAALTDMPAIAASIFHFEEEKRDGSSQLEREGSRLFPSDCGQPNPNFIRATM